jgi:hypothetical protein
MLVTIMLLSLLGMGIGIGTIDPMEEARPLQGLGTGALIWWVISNLIAVFAGAYTAVKLTNVTYRFSGILHGILSWSLYTLISFFLMTTAIGGVISGVGSIVAGGFSAVGAGVTEMADLADEVDTERVNRLIQDALAEDQELGDPEGREFDIDLVAVARDVFIENGEIVTDIEREELEQSIARHSTLSRQDAERAADVVIQEYEQLEQQLQELEMRARETAQEVTDAVSRAAIWSFVALMFGAAAAAFGGNVGKPDPLHDPTRSASV